MKDVSAVKQLVASEVNASELRNRPNRAIVFTFGNDDRRSQEIVCHTYVPNKASTDKINWNRAKSFAKTLLKGASIKYNIDMQQ